MRLAVKQTVCITLLVTLILSVGSVVLVQRSFTAGLEAAAAQNNTRQRLEQYALQSSLSADYYNGIPYSDEAALRYIERFADESLLLVASEGDVLYNTLPGGGKLTVKQMQTPEATEYLVLRINGSYYMLMSGQVAVGDTSLLLTAAYDISYLFSQRNSQLSAHLTLNAILILASATATGILSALLARPLRRLRKASEAMAAGAYTERTNIQTHDEIGELSRHFDAMAQTVEDKITELNTQLKRRDDFIAAFSHEVKTPTTAIIGYADMLRHSPVDSATQLEYGSIVYQEAKRLEGMSQKLLFLLEVTEGEATLKPLPIHVLIQKTIKGFTALPVECTLAPAKILAEADLLAALLLGLLDNARKYAPQGSPVSIDGRVKNSRYQITVQDSGPGIPPEHLPYITELFYRANKARSGEGNGIGLYLCKKIAELHGSTLEIENVPEGGAKVRFTLEVAHEKG